MVEGGLQVRVTLMLEADKAGTQHYIIGPLDDPEDLYEDDEDV